jgi:tRNA(Leu) C34 or U34 (ribose-2'-O)-methylase TrmL
MSNVVKVASYWELGWYAPITEVSLLEFALKEFRVDSLHMVPFTGLSHSNNYLNEYKSFEELIEANSDSTLVFVDEGADEVLSNFEHPDNVLYVFGRTGFSPLEVYRNHGGTRQLSVSIETPQSTGLLWSHQAASVLLYDRALKQKYAKGSQ